MHTHIYYLVVKLNYCQFSAIINVNICRMMFTILYEKEECLRPGAVGRRTGQWAGQAEGQATIRFVIYVYLLIEIWDSSLFFNYNLNRIIVQTGGCAELKCVMECPIRTELVTVGVCPSVWQKDDLLRPPRHLLQPLRGQQRGRGLLRARTHARRRGQVPPEAAAAGLYLYRVQQRPR